MLPADNRLKTKSDFARLFKSGRVYHSKGVSVKIAPNKVGVTRIGFTISTKVSKRAVVRNKIRRRLRTIVGRVLPNIKKGLDIAFLTRKDVLDMSFKELELASLYALEKAGVMVKNDEK